MAPRWRACDRVGMFHLRTLSTCFLVGLLATSAFAQPLQGDKTVRLHARDGTADMKL